MVVFFAFGALTYAAHPEGILEYQKRRWTLRFERLIFHTDPASGGRIPGVSAGPTGGVSPVVPVEPAVGDYG